MLLSSRCIICKNDWTCGHYAIPQGAPQDTRGGHLPKMNSGTRANLGLDSIAKRAAKAKYAQSVV